MKLAILLGLVWFSTITNSSNADDPVIKVIRTATDNQIKETERQVIEQYRAKVEIKVISRNSKREITNLKFVRFDKMGKEGGSCSSDNFGLLIILKDGCKIADLGHEKAI